jgi:hypothetical protein
VEYLSTLGNLIPEIVLESVIHCWPRIVMRSIDHKKFGSGIQPSFLTLLSEILVRSSPMLLHQVIDLYVCSFLFPGYEHGFNCWI